jgi:SPP1 gp7 family putative phage head morphogenesis protein
MATPEAVDLSYAIGLPPAEAIAYFERKGYVMGFNWHDVEAQAHARSFTVAGVLKLDILQDIRAAQTAMLHDGGTETDFARRLLPVLAQKGWLGNALVASPQTGELQGKQLLPRRLETIFRTNMQSSYMAGRWKSLRENVDTRPYWEYVAVMDNRTRPAHAALNGRVFRWDDPIWAVIFPPNGYRCRCRVRALNQVQLDGHAIGLESSEGWLETINQEYGIPGQTRPATGFRDPKTGTLFLPDPGFGINPGEVAWQPDLDKYPTTAARQYVTGSLTGPDFLRGFSQATAITAQPVPAQRWPVAVLAPVTTPEPIAQQTVTVSAPVMQTLATSGVTAADYLLAQQAIESPERVTVTAQGVRYLIHRDGEQIVAIVKDGELVQLLRTTTRQAA